MKTDFKELYHKALGEFNHHANTLEESCGISENYLEKSEKILKSYLLNASEKGTGPLKNCNKRSKLYQGLLYEMDPDSVIEIFFIGHMIGVFEGWSQLRKNCEKDDRKDSDFRISLLSMAAKLHYQALDGCDNLDEEDKLNENFRELLEKTLMK